MKVSAQYAEEHFADILSAVDNGEVVEIARPGKPTFLLVPAPNSVEDRPAPKIPLLGAAKGEIWLADDWDSPETNKETEDLFENSILFPELPVE